MRGVVVGLLGIATVAAAEDFDLARGGASIVVSAGVLDSDRKVPAESFQAPREEAARRRLRESVGDLSRILSWLTGQAFPIVTEDRGSLGPQIFIGSEAAKVFGDVGGSAPDRQRWRMVVEAGRAGLYGESDLATSYAIYTLLESLGCRWFVPGELGECLPPEGSIRVLQARNVSGEPFTIYRGVWFADDAFRRRNRLRDMEERIESSHALENYITKDQRVAHPGWCALIDGTRDPERRQLAWGNPEVARAVGEAIIAKLEKRYRPSMSLSPLDQHRFSEGPEDLALDAGMWDSTMQSVAVADRLVHFANAIVKTVAVRFPDVRFGMLAYHQYVMPPARERPDPRIVPVIAPISYNRFHSLLDDRVGTSPVLREIVRGWGKICPIGYYGYAFNLAEPLAPFPMIRRYSRDLPFLFQHNVRYWYTETMPTFEANLHGLTLGIRLSWDPLQSPEDIVADLNSRFYGPASVPMGEYWDMMDQAWNESLNLAGGAHGYLERFPESLIRRADGLLATAEKASWGTSAEPRVALARDSFDLHGSFLSLLRDLQEGRLDGIDERAKAYASRIDVLIARYGPHFFAGQFGKRYFASFWLKVFSEAGQLVDPPNTILAGPIRDFLITPSAPDALPPETPDGLPIRTGVTHWNQLGYMDYFGPMWYDATIELPASPPTETVLLWLSSFDDKAEVFVNGLAAAPVRPDAKSPLSTTGFCEPARFDVSGLIREGENRLQIRVTRTTINETGTGGLLAPVYIFSQSDSKSKTHPESKALSSR